MPSPSNGLVPKPPGIVPSSMIVDVVARDLLSKLAGEERSAAIDGVAVDCLRKCAPELTSRPWDRTRSELSRSSLCAHPAVAEVRSAAILANLLRRYPASSASARPSTSSRAASRHLRSARSARPPPNSRTGDIRRRIRASWPGLCAGSRVERSALGILDARIEVERGLLGAARVSNAVGAGQRIDVFVIEIEIALDLPELIGCGNPSEWILGGDLRESERGTHQESSPLREKSLE